MSAFEFDYPAGTVRIGDKTFPIRQVQNPNSTMCTSLWLVTNSSCEKEMLDDNLKIKPEYADGCYWLFLAFLQDDEMDLHGYALRKALNENVRMLK